MEKNLRQIREELERNTLSEFACLATDTKGRKVYEEPCEMRTDFARDRDRIIHCRTFRRLKHKTQVFLSPEGDHYRTRLTHTLEVAQIARTLARALNLNEDLTEAVALGHDLGHTPFGHAGEGVLAKISPLGFKHYEQSVRVVEFLEKGGKGLNLTHEVIDGIRCHTRGTEAETLEGRIVRYADKIAYINHDIDDAVRGMIISEDELPREAVAVLGNTKSKRIDTLLRGVIAGSMGKNEIKMTDEVFAAFDLLHDFMFDRVYLGSRAKEEEKKAEQIVEMLYNHYFNDVDELPDFYKGIAEKEGKDRAVCDFVAGMTDRYAISKFEEIFLPKTWNLK